MKVAIIQLTSKLDYKENLQKLEYFLEEASSKGTQAAFLPECFYSMSDGSAPTPHLVEPSNEHFNNIRNLAKKYNMAIIGGSAATSLDGKVINRSYNFDSNGNDLGYYDKIHLFSCDIKKGDKRKKIDEGDIYTSGSESKIIELDGIKVGLGICFDLRFSEMALDYRRSGAQILTFSSAFTVPTGKAHWHVLNRARAIESQCYVIASAQWGRNNDKIQTYGHSLIIDPWGEVLVDLEEGESVGYCELDFSLIDLVRSQVIMGRE
jgi:predicted amidohydrolase